MVELAGFHGLVYAIGLVILGIIFTAFILLLVCVVITVFEKIFIFLDILFSKEK